jgi:predicted DsbA family dithiol-disulfide isomerase
MADAPVCIVEFTDPGCPWAYSAEPVRWRLLWLYGRELGWRRRMVGLASDPQEYIDRGFTPEKQAEALADIARDHRMPIDAEERPRMAATVPACLSVVAARLHVPLLEESLLRRLRIRAMSGELLDEPVTLAAAARDVGLDPQTLGGWAQEEAVRRALEEDMAAARTPVPAARVLDHKLANWSGGRRYTCPSYEVVREDGVRIAIPGFQPFEVYDVVLANLRPDLERRSEPDSVSAVLEWAGEPLATAEVAAICGLSFEEARSELGRIGVEEHVGWDGFWSLPAEQAQLAS